MQDLLQGVELVIFDMDGLLVDSEPYWKAAEKKVFGELGLNLDDGLLRQVMGFRLNEVVAHWYAYHPWADPNLEQTERDVLETVRKLILDHAEALPGVYATLDKLRSKGLTLAVASSSPMSLIDAVVEKLGIRPYFDLLWSAQYEEYGKPHPAIFLSVARQLSVAPARCLVLEDAPNGMIAAKAARMKCLVVPEPATFHDPRWALADLKLPSLSDFSC